jgi:hypothetical protein
MNDNFAQVTFGIELLGGGDPAQDPVQEEVCLAMTPRTLKVVAYTLNAAVAAFEKVAGEIRLPETARAARHRSRVRNTVSGDPTRPPT